MSETIRPQRDKGRKGVDGYDHRRVCSNLNINSVCVSERLVRQREILEERAERRLEIFKNLVDNLSASAAAAAVCWNKLSVASSKKLLLSPEDVTDIWH